jgi:hypothetical protein
MVENNINKLPTSTLPEGLQIGMRNYADEETARSIGNTVLYIGKEIGKSFDLSNLDGITVTYDYDQVLLELDRGMEGLKPLKASKEHSFGVAMTPTVMREGQVKAHIVIHAGTLEPLLDENHADYDDALNLIVYEFGHVHDIATKERAFPGSLMNECMKDALDSYLFETSEGCWSEYTACRLSSFIHHGMVNKYEEVFCEILEKAKMTVDDEIASYHRWHTDTQKLMENAVVHYGSLMRYAAYLIGHLHGAKQDLAEAAPLAAENLKGCYFEETFIKLENALKTM